MPNRFFPIIALVLCLMLLKIAPVRAEAPSAPVPRVPWTTSRVVGSPEPPLPYQLERAYPKLTFAHPLDMGFAPGSRRRFRSLFLGAFLPQSGKKT